MKKLVVLVSLIVGISSATSTSAQALSKSAITNLFSRITAGSALADPSIIVIDKLTGEVVFRKNSNSPRKPASVMKIYTAAAALTYLKPDQRFTTSVWLGIEKKSIVIQGSLDPWFSLNSDQAKKMGRTSLPRIEYKSLSALRDANKGSIRNSTIYYSNLYSKDVAYVKSFYKKRGINATMLKVTSLEAQALSDERILTSKSPELQEMLAFTLTWSDNVLAERIARVASRAAGNSLNDQGVAQTFTQMLDDLGVERKGLVIRDASGLSRKNRVTANQVGQLLLKIRSDSRFAPLLSGLPISGLTGTLKNRFVETAREAVGLVKAKTGTLSGTANLAGYVEAGDREYIFVIIADRLKRTYSAANLARKTVDRILGKIASPLLPQLPGQPNEIEIKIEDGTETNTATTIEEAVVTT
jgi:serine-type D-Ala-D-Ala carboxypeptidase/endopeptidase (penicillin-binding protein 4)